MGEVVVIYIDQLIMVLLGFNQLRHQAAADGEVYQYRRQVNIKQLPIEMVIFTDQQ